MKKRTLILAMTALMITMTSAGNCTAVYAEETAAATEDAGSTEFPIKPLSAKVVDENPYMADSDSNIHMTAIIPIPPMRCFRLASTQKSMFLTRRQILMLRLQSFLTPMDMP